MTTSPTTHTTPVGLSAAQVAESRARHGANTITPPPATPWWREFLDKFRDPLIIVLMVAGILSIIVAVYEYYTDPAPSTSVFFEPLGIFIAIGLATTLSFIFERKASKEFKLLARVSDDEPVTVIRDGNPTSVPRRDVVVGDIVVLTAGEEIPADGRLLQSVEMTVDESTLTGEPLAHKTANPAHFDPQATYPSNALMRGTKVMEGHGLMEVTAVGDHTENGRVLQLSCIDTGGSTPLNEQMQRLGRAISYMAYAAAALVVGGRLAMFFLYNPDPITWLGFVNYLLHTLMLAVALIAVAVPEGLPMAVTLSLAYSMRRMLRNNNMVRRLHACETMGASTVICTDKTGTLTRNQMRVTDAVFFGGVTPDIYRALAINSTATLDLGHGPVPQALGNPTEGALLLWLHDQGVDFRPLREEAQVLAEVPFSTERKYMATLIALPAGGSELLIKGAPEIVMSMCSAIDGDIPASEVHAMLLKLQSQGKRTLAFAALSLPPGAPSPIAHGNLSLPLPGIHLLGIAGISDPVRPDVPAAVNDCRAAGIDIKIVTGDTPATAIEIARQIGLWDDSTPASALATGPEIEAMTDEELRARAKSLKIIARSRPLDKKRLVEALRALGETVAATGDGTNDAPALRAADVGLSMGSGTSVAKEASDITILDDSFTSISAAVMWGRSLYRNIQRFILFQLTVNVVACLTVLCGAFMGTDSPLTVTQMLWVNLIMDTFAAVALATLPPSHQVMSEPPRRRSDSIITPKMWWFIAVMGLWMFGLLTALLYYLQHTAEASSLHDLIFPAGQPRKIPNLTPFEQTAFFTTFVMMQFWTMFNAKAFHSTTSWYDMRGAGEFLLIMLLIFLVQVAITVWGGSFFNAVPLPLDMWVAISAASAFAAFIPGTILRHLLYRNC